MQNLPQKSGSAASREYCQVRSDWIRENAGHDRSFEEIVNEFRAFFRVEERMVVFALLAAQLADIGNAQRDDRQRRIDLQRGKGGVSKRGAHVGQPRQAQVGRVAAFARSTSAEQPRLVAEHLLTVSREDAQPGYVAADALKSIRARTRDPYAVDADPFAGATD